MATMKGLTAGLVAAVAAMVATVLYALPRPPKWPVRVRPLTRDGTHAEAYWSFDGKKIVLMGERAGDPADQIYELDVATGRLTRVSTGQGKSTCAYYLPDGRLIYSSTHLSGAAPPARPDRAKGYVWPFFREFELFLREKDGTLKRLTDNDGYDAEATVSPDGARIVFTSHRDGGMGLYTMNVDGTDLRRVSTRRGYAGGAVYSPDGKWLVYRAFYPQTPEDEAVLDQLLNERLLQPTKCHFEVFLARPDGSEERALTSGRKVNWAPTFHPDGRTIVFASNRDAARPGQFSLYAMNVDGTGVRRLTFHDGFESFPHFSPDGTKLVFISNRGGKDPRRDLNVFLADWRELP
jgi:Tol biopolymer transport system component